jgi:hypothetical protein
MIVNRPLILSRLTSAHEARPYIDMCLTAAHHVLEMVLDLSTSNFLFAAFWNIQYTTFSALSVVYVWVIQRRKDHFQSVDSRHNERSLYNLAENVQGHLAEATQRNAPNLRYSVILEELKQEALRSLRRREPQDLNEQTVTVASTPASRPNHTPGQCSQSNSLSEWESLVDFPLDPELWLQLDSFPFDSRLGFNNLEGDSSIGW